MRTWNFANILNKQEPAIVSLVKAKYSCPAESSMFFKILQLMKTKEEILGQSFYPHECGGMIECVTKQDALLAMKVYGEIMFELGAKAQHQLMMNAYYESAPDDVITLRDCPLATLTLISNV